MYSTISLNNCSASVNAGLLLSFKNQWVQMHKYLLFYMESYISAHVVCAECQNVQEAPITNQTSAF